MNATDIARAALAVATEAHARSAEAETLAREAVAAAEQALATDDSDTAARAVLDARAELELARVKVEGADRRVNIAREAGRAAELQEARETLARDLPIADRATFYASITDDIATIATLAQVAPPDLFATPIGNLRAALHAEADRQFERANRARAIRGAAEEQRRAVASVRAARLTLGEVDRGITDVTEGEIARVLDLETIVLGGASLDALKRWVATISIGVYSADIVWRNLQSCSDMIATARAAAMSDDPAGLISTHGGRAEDVRRQASYKGDMAPDQAHEAVRRARYASGSAMTN